MKIPGPRPNPKGSFLEGKSGNGTPETVGKSAVGEILLTILARINEWFGSSEVIFITNLLT